MKICDLTQFYSPVSGGVKRYLHEKIDYIERHAPRDEHVLIVPGPKTKVNTNRCSRVYTIRSPLVSRTAQYRALLNLRAVEEILEQENPDVIESGDPYQVGWKAVKVGRALRVPVIGFYHSHFPEAYVRNSARLLGKMATRRVMKLSRDRKSTRLNSSHGYISYAVFCLKKKKTTYILSTAYMIQSIT